jgi:trigger factor
VADLAGKRASFDVTAKGLKRAVVPPADDELAKKIGFEDLNDLKAGLKSRFQHELDQLGRLRVKRQLLDALAERASFAVPQGMVEAEFNQIWQRLEAERKQGKVEEEDAGKDDETLKAEYRAIAERRVRLGLLLSEIGRTNGISVAEDELTRAMRAEAARYPGQEQKIMEFFRKNPQAAEGLRGPIFEEKVIDFVLELARVTDSTVSAEELARDPETPAGTASPVASGTPEAPSEAGEPASVP